MTTYDHIILGTGQATGTRLTVVLNDGTVIADSAEDIARGMLDLQDRGADVLILRRPSHVIAQSLDALAIAVERGNNIVTLTAEEAQPLIDAVNTAIALVEAES